MGIDSHLSTCVGTQSPKYLEMAQGHISLSLPIGQISTRALSPLEFEHRTCGVVLRPPDQLS
jgi:hypothetical protein